MNNGDRLCHVANGPKWLSCMNSHRDVNQLLMYDQLNSCNRLVQLHFYVQQLMNNWMYLGDRMGCLNYVMMFVMNMNRNIAVQLCVDSLHQIHYSNVVSVNNYTYIDSIFFLCECVCVCGYFLIFLFSFSQIIQMAPKLQHWAQQITMITIHFIFHIIFLLNFDQVRTFLFFILIYYVIQDVFKFCFIAYIAFVSVVILNFIFLIFFFFSLKELVFLQRPTHFFSHFRCVFRKHALWIAFRRDSSYKQSLQFQIYLFFHLDVRKK